MVNFEPPWNPARLEQRIGRVHRMGQMQPVQVIHLLTENSIEERVWETLEATGERARWASGFLVRNGDRFFINNDHGDLIIARLSPEGYQEISRTHLIQPTANPGNRREKTTVNWSHPAYANRHIFARNDEEILSASLEK